MMAGITKAVIRRTAPLSPFTDICPVGSDKHTLAKATITSVMWITLPHTACGHSPDPAHWKGGNDHPAICDQCHQHHRCVKLIFSSPTYQKGDASDATRSDKCHQHHRCAEMTPYGCRLRPRWQTLHRLRQWAVCYHRKKKTGNDARKKNSHARTARRLFCNRGGLGRIPSNYCAAVPLDAPTRTTTSECFLALCGPFLGFPFLFCSHSVDLPGVHQKRLRMAMAG